MSRLKTTLMLATVALGACGSDDNNPADAAPLDAATEAAPDAVVDAAAEGCPTETEIAFDTEVMGTTGEGWDMNLSDWFDNSDVACDPFGTDYPPPFRVYSLPMPAQSDWDVVATPMAGTDVSLVAWTQGADDRSCRPERGIRVVSCEVSNGGMAGAEERVRLNAVQNPFRLVILVATPPGGTPGAFRVRVVPH